MRRGLQIAVAILSLAPLGFGLLIWLLGSARYIPTPEVTAAIDSQLRFQSGVYVAGAVLLWWMIPQIEKVTVPFRIITLGIFFGALGRLLSFQQYGLDPSFPIAGFVIELSMPLLIVWQALVAKRYSDPPAANGAP